MLHMFLNLLAENLLTIETQGLCPVIERRPYKVTPSLIGWVQTKPRIIPETWKPSLCVGHGENGCHFAEVSKWIFSNEKLFIVIQPKFVD